MTRPRSMQEIVEQADELARKFEDFEPSESLMRGLWEAHMGKTRRRDDLLDNFVDDEDEE